MRSLLAKTSHEQGPLALEVGDSSARHSQESGDGGDPAAVAHGREGGSKVGIIRVDSPQNKVRDIFRDSFVIGDTTQ